MKNFLPYFSILVLLIILTFAFRREFLSFFNNIYYKDIPKEIVKDIDFDNSVEIFAENLDVPWEVAFLPNKDMLVTLRKGEVLVFRNKEIISRFNFPGVSSQGEGGLLGIAVHPKFSQNNYVYFYFTQKINNTYKNIVSRYKLVDGNFTFDKNVLEDIRGNIFHNAGKIEFGPDGFLYVTAGDALDEPSAQNKNEISGKILRIDFEGNVPLDNPFSNYVYSYGHRNPQGLTWDNEGNLWSTEHGQSGISSGQDELNKIIKGGNYGWPNVRGNEYSEGFISPEIQSGDNIVWAPGDAEYYKGNIFFTGLRGEGLYKYNLDKKTLDKYFDKDFGRLRAITLGPDGKFYITTSNRDGRGAPKSSDDKIIKVNPNVFEKSDL